MKLPNNVEYVIELPPERLYRLRTIKPPAVGARKGVYVCEGYAITPTRFVAIVATCECSGFTLVKYMYLVDWAARTYSDERCRICSKPVETRFQSQSPKRKILGWGYL
jgi:hypothetical protein